MRWAAREAACRGVPLRLVCAVDTTALRPIQPPSLGEGYRGDVLVDQATTHLERAAAEVARIAPTMAISWEVLDGGASAALRAESGRTRLLVLGSRGRGAVAGLLAGSVSVDLAARARCPVVVVRGAAPEAAPIVVGADGSVGGEAALSFAFAEAAIRGVPVIAVRGVEPAARTPTWRPRWTRTPSGRTRT